MTLLPSSWAFVFLDIAEVFVASQVVYFCIYRPLRRRRARQQAAMHPTDSAAERA